MNDQRPRPILRSRSKPPMLAVALLPPLLLAAISGCGSSESPDQPPTVSTVTSQTTTPALLPSATPTPTTSGCPTLD